MGRKGRNEMAVMPGIIVLLILGVVFVGLCFLERMLARKKAWWPGLILPGLSLLWALFSSLNYPQSTTSTDPLVIAASIGMNFLLSDKPFLWMNSFGNASSFWSRNGLKKNWNCI